MKSQVFIFLSCLIGSSISMAYNISGCASYINDGLYRKYKYMGQDGALGKVCTQKKGLTTKESSVDFSSESTTALFDPKYTMRVALSHSQYTSSWGKCSGLGFLLLQDQREKYYAQNQDEILKEIAMGRGEHLMVLADMSLCEDHGKSEFTAQLQNHTDKFIDLKGSAGGVMDQIVRGNQTLSKTCYNFGG